MKRIIAVGFLSIFLVTACSDHGKTVSNQHTPVVTTSYGYVVPDDSLLPPVVIPVNQNLLPVSKAGNPTVVPTNTNIHIAGTPRITFGVNPPQTTVKSPGDTSITADTLITAVPEIMIAKDAYTKDQNPQNFSSFNKLQGLKHGNVRCLLEDELGNIWLGTEGGGVSKYDG